MKKGKYPCTECEDKETCWNSEKYKRCIAWRLWFHREWQSIRIFCGVECVDSTLEEEV